MENLKFPKPKKDYCLLYQTLEGYCHTYASETAYLIFQANNDKEAVEIAKKRNPGAHASLFKFIKEV